MVYLEIFDFIAEIQNVTVSKIKIPMFDPKKVKKSHFKNRQSWFKHQKLQLGDTKIEIIEIFFILSLKYAEFNSLQIFIYRMKK